MSDSTIKIGLIKPVVTDEIHQTIADLATNFQKLDDLSEMYADAIPSSGTWTKKQRIWNNNPTSGGYMGWVAVRGGQAAQKWASLYPYSLGDLMVPLYDNGHVYQCTQSGTSGITVPTLPVVGGATVEDHNGSSTWQAATDIAVNAVVVPSIANGSFYVAETAGTTGSTEPLWSATAGDPNVDNGITWRTYKIVVWKEIGTSVLFKGFGIIA